MKVRFKIIVHVLLNAMEGFARLMDRINMDNSVRQVGQVMQDFVTSFTGQFMRVRDRQLGGNR